MITTVLFDYYNTLYGAHEWFGLEVRELSSAVMRALDARGYAYTREQQDRVRTAYRRVREGVHESGREVSAVDGLRRAFEDAGLGAPGGLREIVADLEQESFVPGRELPGATECVRRLFAEGYRLAVVSNALDTGIIHRSLVTTGIAECFGGVYGSADIGWYKSSPELYRTVLKELGARPEEAVHVGDSYRFDVLGAKAAGLWTIWLNAEGEEPEENIANATVRGLDEVPVALAGMY